MALLLDRGTELHQLFGYGLVGRLEHVDQSASKALVGFREEGDGAAILTGTAGTVAVLARLLTVSLRGVLELTGQCGERSPPR